MLRGKIWQTLPLLVISAASVNCLSVEANEPQSSPHDNSGRRIAQILPAAISVKPMTMHSAPVSPSGWISAVDRLHARTSEATASANQQLASITPALPLPQSARDALLNGATAAEGLTKIAARRVADFATWGAVLWENLNDVPHITPAADISPFRAAAAQPSTSVQQKTNQQVY
jgi:hypothetical protein